MAEFIKKTRVFVAMSGGVDSSVAAWLLKNQGHEVVGVFMRCYNLDGCAERDAEDARRVAEKIGIPFYVWDFEKDYKRRVVDYMVDGYRQGITPNPDVMCNREIKFGLFFDRALAAGADFMATGHYVRIAASRDSNSTPHVSYSMSLFTARDASKDQSYFLWTLTQEKLRHCLFPIGDYLKSEVREMARRAGLLTAEKKDSQGICFLGKVTLEDFLKQYIPESKGAVLAATGQVVGEHNGAHFYTIGQRHIGIANRKSQIANKGDFKPLYVFEKSIENNTLVVAEGSDNQKLYKKDIELCDANFIDPVCASTIRTNKRIRVFARVRYRQPLAGAELEIESEKFKVIFDSPQKFVAPGQSAVFYGEGGEMLGGGVIC